MREQERRQKAKQHLEKNQHDTAKGCWLEKPKRRSVLSNQLPHCFFHPSVKSHVSSPPDTAWHAAYMLQLLPSWWHSPKHYRTSTAPVVPHLSSTDFLPQFALPDEEKARCTYETGNKGHSWEERHVLEKPSGEDMLMVLRGGEPGC